MFGGGHKANDFTVAMSKEVKTGCNLAESSEQGCGSKYGCFACDKDDRLSIECEEVGGM
jgi:hypothetical protein